MFSENSSSRAASSKTGEAGQTLLELIIVVSVSVIIIGALVFATISSLRNAQFSKNQSQATKLAQAGIEQVRIGRDRNQCVNILGTSVNSWNGNSSNQSCPGAGSVWGYQITGIAGNCENTTVPSKCYFRVDSTGSLSVNGFSRASFPDDVAEGIPAVSPVFRRVIVLSDDATTYGSQKTVTAIVKWVDFSGSHQSQLTTILRNLTQ